METWGASWLGRGCHAPWCAWMSLYYDLHLFCRWASSDDHMHTSVRPLKGISLFSFCGCIFVLHRMAKKVDNEDGVKCMGRFWKSMSDTVTLPKEDLLLRLTANQGPGAGAQSSRFFKPSWRFFDFSLRCLNLSWSRREGGFPWKENASVGHVKIRGVDGKRKANGALSLSFLECSTWSSMCHLLMEAFLPSTAPLPCDQIPQRMSS